MKIVMAFVLMVTALAMAHAQTLTRTEIDSSDTLQQTSPRLRTLYTFAGGSDGGDVESGVVIGSGGVLYGTTFNGGIDVCYSGCGTVFSLTPPASPGGAWTESVLYRFKGGPSDGTNPVARVVIGSGGVLYGTTKYEYPGNTSAPCGSAGCGTVFSLTPPASPGGAWTETVLHTFTSSGGDGAYPCAGVVISKRGVLYGTTYGGGSSGFGTVFSLTPPASPGSAWTETVLHTFTSSGGDGANPMAGVVFGKGGVLYGATQLGGNSNLCNGGCGTVFSLTPPASPGPWTETVLHEFAGGSDGDGATPSAGVVIGSGGVLYGATSGGGTSGYGTVFSLTPPASPGGAWTESVLYSFKGSPSDGTNPNLDGVVIGTGGVLYGATVTGGTVHPSCGIPGCGVAFQLTPPASPGGVWTETVLHDFTSGSDGVSPNGLVIGSGGMLYGTTYGGGGALGWGTVFALKP